MAFVESFAGFFADMGSNATIGVATVRGIFDDSYVDALGIQCSGPTFTCSTDDVSSVTTGTALTIGGVGYTVSSKQPDGTGMVRLVLQES